MKVNLFACYKLEKTDQCQEPGIASESGLASRSRALISQYLGGECFTTGQRVYSYIAICPASSGVDILDSSVLWSYRSKGEVLSH